MSIGFFYVAAPYSEAVDKDMRWRDITHHTANLIKMGMNCYSPITHGHPMAGTIGEKPIEFWLALDMPFLEAAKGILVLKFDGWEESLGVKAEIEVAKKAGKLVIYQDVKG